MASPVSTLAGKHNNEKGQPMPVTVKPPLLIDPSWEANESTSLDNTPKPRAEELRRAQKSLEQTRPSLLDMLEGLADTFSTIAGSIRALSATDGSMLNSAHLHWLLEVPGDRGRSTTDLKAAAAQAALEDLAKAEQGNLEAVQSLDLERQEAHGAHAKGRGIKNLLAHLAWM